MFRARSVCFNYCLQDSWSRDESFIGEKTLMKIRMSIAGAIVELTTPTLSCDVAVPLDGKEK